MSFDTLWVLPNKQKWLGNWLEMTSLSRKSAKTEPFSFCDSTGSRLQLLYRKSYAEKVQEVEKDPEIPVSFRNAVQKNRYNNNGDNKFRNRHH